MTDPSRRALLSFLAAPFLFDCGPPPPPERKKGITVVTGKWKPNAKRHAMMAATTNYAFMSAIAYLWPRFLEPLSTDGIPFLEALRAKGYGLEMQVTVEPATSEGSADGVNMMLFFPKKGQPRKQPPEGEMIPDGVDEILIHKGRLALWSVGGMMGNLSTSSRDLQSSAFALLVLREKIKAGEKADWADPNRPAEESLSDIDLALQFIGESYEQIQLWRVGVIAMVALIVAFDQPGGIEALKAAITRANTESQTWLATHKQPNLDDFGIALELLPEPEPVVKKLDLDLGILEAAIQTARGIVTGSPQMTLEGLSKLAPKDSTAATALAGLAAASKGDVSGVIDSVAKLTGKDKEVAAIKQELAPFHAVGKKAGVL